MDVGENLRRTVKRPSTQTGTQSEAKKMKSSTQTGTESEPKKTKSSTTTELDQLPAEILLKILRYVPQSGLLQNVCRVSKKFYELTTDSSIRLWVTLDIDSKPSHLNSFFLHRSHQISDLDLILIDLELRRCPRRCPSAVLRWIEPYFASMKNLASIKVKVTRRFELPPSFTAQLFQHCHSLSDCNLDFMGAEWFSCLSKRTEENFNRSWPECADLSKLSCLRIRSFDIPNHCLKTIASRCPNLEYCRMAADYRNYVSKEGIHNFLRNLKKLEELALWYFYDHDRSDLINFEADGFDVHSSKHVLCCKRKITPN